MRQRKGETASSRDQGIPMDIKNNTKYFLQETRIGHIALRINAYNKIIKRIKKR